MKKTVQIITLIIIMGLTNCSTTSNQEENKLKSSTDSLSYYSDLAHSYYQSGDLDKSREMYLKLLEFEEPRKLNDIILRKRLFFVPDTFQAPIELIKETFVLKPLRASHAELDYKAVMSSVDHLTGVLGRRDWPGDLTLDEDRKALAGHEWEFKKRTGFVYTVMNKAESQVIGCVYIYPSRLDDFDTEIVMWVTEKEFNNGMDEALFNTITEWINEEWPFESAIYPGREISWGEFFEKLDKQDEKYIK